MDEEKIEVELCSHNQTQDVAVRFPAGTEREQVFHLEADVIKKVCYHINPSPQKPAVEMA